MNENKYILVTGGAGYLGSHTVVALYEQGYLPVIVDDFRNSNDSILKGLKQIIGEEQIFFNIDVGDEEQLRTVFEQYKFSGIMHFAADKSVVESVRNPIKYYENNIGSLLSCLKLVEEFSIPNFVFSSSCTVYGEPDEVVVTEQSAIKEAASPYGATKQICERIIQDVHQNASKCRFLSLRYFNPIGAHPSALIGELPLGIPDNLVPYVTQTGIGKRDKLTVFGNDYETEDGSCMRDFIHVMDLADAHIGGLNWLAAQEDSVAEVINIGTGRGVSVLEIIHTFEKVSNQRLNWQFGPRRSGDVTRIYADNSKAKELLGWMPKYSVEDALASAWAWEQKLAND